MEESKPEVISMPVAEGIRKMLKHSQIPLSIPWCPLILDVVSEK